MTRNTATSRSSEAVHVYGNPGLRGDGVRRDVAPEPAGSHRPACVSGNCDLNDLSLLLGLTQPSSAL